jgi:crotonobetainyl-CoA:carnitine CoA-transferase CaiB-like acyl-CoA transferase
VRLNDAGAPCASIWHIEDIIAHRQVQHRGVLQTVDSPWGALSLVGSGFRLAHGSGRLDLAAHAAGEDTDAILAEAGLAPADIAALRENAVI